MQTTLSPTQQAEYNALTHALPVGNIFVVHGETGMGKTTLLEELHRAEGGVLLTMRRFLSAMRGVHPLAMEEAFDQMMREALDSHPLVIMDDLHLLYDVVGGCNLFYPRKEFLNGPLTTLVSHAVEDSKTLVFGIRGEAPHPISSRAYTCRLDRLREEDYAFFCHLFFHARPGFRLDVSRIFRYAPRLNVHQLKNACHYLALETELTTERFIEYLRDQKITSNVHLNEVEAADLRDLKGVEEVVRSLEANIILPLEDDALSQELALRPKRGVLLAGPPGTGKTTIGRALAHRLKSKFFLIDGTYFAGSHDFYERVDRVFEAARQNAPSVLFIDDCDVLFAEDRERGLYRYLLTMLDGLESETAGHVCVILTAANVRSLPPALVRSGRVDLWLELRLPDADARQSILNSLSVELPTAFAGLDQPHLAQATEGLTGADLKRIVEDGKLLYAYDRSQDVPLRPVTDYFLDATEAIRESKRRYADAAGLAMPSEIATPLLAVTHLRTSPSDSHQ